MIPQSLLSRLQSLKRHLDEEGWHVHSNTVQLTMDEVTKRRRGRPPTGFDKKAYDRERMRRIRAEAKSNTPSNNSNTR